MKGLQDKVALVTAAAGAGMGKATAQRLAQEGAIVVVTDSHARRTQETAEELGREFPNRVIGFPLDVSDRRNVAEVVGAVEARLGRIDILVNNAGINAFGGVSELSPEDWQRVLDVDLTGCFNMIRMVLPGMKKRRHGAIINIASVAAWTTNSSAPYNAAKAGVLALTRTVAAEAGPDGVRCNAIAPGMILTKWVETHWKEIGGDQMAKDCPMRRGGRPEEVAAVTCFLASDDASYITGEAVTVSGGWYMHA
ncbi:MAG TPA: SDR family NAD(P)-dependent oxidoreductase [Candidatus Binataceae bacterium]|jgi:3-oxoacyl-[acyl-carrier protein] reductase